jgi:hypothetical protein
MTPVSKDIDFVGGEQETVVRLKLTVDGRVDSILSQNPLLRKR